ncbi:MAG: hypothetical protein ACK551_08035 [Vampirovibrionales bacterium]
MPFSSFMRCVFAILLLAMFSSVQVMPTAEAWMPQWGLSKTNPALKNVTITGATASDERVLEVLEVVQGLLNAAKARNIDEFMKHYANAYVSGDNLTRSELRKLILETWEQYPNMQYNSTVLEIRINGNWITVETEDVSLATGLATPMDMLATGVAADSSLFLKKNETGTLATRSRNLMYLRKIGDHWRIDSDQSLYEDAVLRYGKTDGLEIEFSVPDKVFAGQSYTAAVEAGFPPNSVAMTSVNRSEMVYPHPRIVNAMRVMAPAQNSLERVFTANSNSRNEMVSASLGLLQGKRVLGPNGEPAVSLTLSGVVTLVKRVNVASKAEDTPASRLQGVVMNSANGKIDFSKEKAKSEEEDHE